MKVVACYIRVSSVENDQAMQRRDINGWLKKNRVAANARRWYVDKPARSEPQQPKLEQLRRDIDNGKVHVIVMRHLDRLSLSTRRGLELLIDWCGASMQIVSVSQQIEIMSKEGVTVASILQGVAEMDKHSRRERTRVGLAVANSEGRIGGRPRISPDETNVLKVKKLQKDGRLSVGDVCRRLNISRSTYYRYVRM